MPLSVEPYWGHDRGLFFFCFLKLFKVSEVKNGIASWERISTAVKHELTRIEVHSDSESSRQSQYLLL